MAEFPPPPPPPDRAETDAGRAARLERLAQRRSAPPTDRTETSADRSSRLERLAQRTPASGESAATGTPRQRRKHPAKGARAAALGLSLTATAGLAGLFAMMSRTASAETAAVIVSGGSRGPAGPTVGGDHTAASPTVAGGPVTTNGGGSTSATVTQPARATVVDGAVFRNKWGPVQVEATFASDGTLTDVAALQTPDDRGQSVRINDYAVPRLTSEALTAQSASVDTVSGATYTSEGYRQSLQSAIDLARGAGATALA
jgi:uncharacterized protein with FMN-binding domain